MNLKNDKIDDLLSTTFRNAGLRKPSSNFAMEVMERVELSTVKHKSMMDWDLTFSIIAITVSTGIIFSIFPDFFLQIFSKTGFEKLFHHILIQLQNMKLTPLAMGYDFLILLTAILSILSLILLDKIIIRFQQFRSFFLLV